MRPKTPLHDTVKRKKFCRSTGKSLVHQELSVKYVCDLSNIKQARGWGKYSDEFSLFYKILLFREGDERIWHV